MALNPEGSELSGRRQTTKYVIPLQILEEGLYKQPDTAEREC